jgi:predicted nucleic acid-binding Zn ribbon protein
MTAATQKEVATVQYILQQYHTASANTHVNAVVEQLKKCRTAALGYHLYKCGNNDCAQYKYQYHSCRNRHCPACGALQKEQWIEDRRRELLPIPYYHVVFTLPHELNCIILGNRKQLYKLLFDAATQTLLCFAQNPAHLGALPGILSVLHTWGQQLSFHPHVHCIVSGGGMATSIQKNKNNTIKVCWKNAKRNKDNFLFPVKAMAIVYKAKYLEGLKKLIASGQIAIDSDSNIHSCIKKLYNKEWVVYAKKPFGGPQQVIEYLGRYTHKVAITNNRINAVDDISKTVTFNYKDYGCNGAQKQMPLNAAEFIRRFEQHILPKYFTKIRSYGYLGNRNRKTNIAAIVQYLKIPAHPNKVNVPWQVGLLERFNIIHNQCPHCKQQSLVLVATTFKEKFIPDG